MSLYIRVFTSFYTHRKTVRLRVALGNDAYWIPPRLWAYAAENQPDGDFADYSDDEVAGLIGYTGNASSMLQALLKAGFLDSDRRIHDWGDFNSYHQVFAERARKAAKGRWGKESNKEKEPDNEKTVKGKETSIASSIRKHASSIKDPLTELVIPPSLNSPEFLAAWSGWVGYRKALGGVKDWPSLFQSQLDDISQLTPEKAIHCIKTSKNSGWKGLFPDKHTSKSDRKPESNQRPEEIKIPTLKLT